MNRQPILPKSDQKMSQESNAYRKALHEALYPKGVEWNPSTGGVSSSSISGEYVGMGRMTVFSVVLEGSSAGAGAYIDLPVTVSQDAVFNVAIGTTYKFGVVAKGASRLYLPEWTPSGRAVISGVTVS